jgi:hypothetical protein
MGEGVMASEIDPVESAARSSDVYVFYTDTSDKVGHFDPAQNPDFRFLADMEPCPGSPWRWTAFAVIEVADMLQLSTAANRIVAPPDPPDETAKPVKHGSKVLRSPPHFPCFGFARLRVQVGHASEVLDGIDGRTGYSGSAIVSGKFQILVEMGSDNPDEVCDLLMGLAEIPGVTGVEAAQVTGELYYYRPRKRRVCRPEDEEG